MSSGSARPTALRSELAVVATRFHLKPLLPAMEANQRFYLLALSQDAAKVYEENHQTIIEMAIHDMPESPIISLGARGAERQLQGHTADRRSSGRRVAILHGHGAGEEDRKERLLSYFRRVDEIVRRKLGDEHVPVVLAAVDYLCPIYRQAGANPNLLTEEIHGNPASFDSDELQRLAWGIASSHFQEDRSKAVDEYHQLWHTQRTSKELPAIVTAARQGRVKVLFVAVGVQEWGHVDPSSVEVVQVELRSAHGQDLLNVAAMETFIAGGTVYAVPPDEVPGRLGENGYQHVKQNFLLTRHVKDYMLVMLALDHPDEDVVYLE
ncbi:MAG: hypothetical protein HY820_02260 [Acidobacteria bacterium]|nr:hypothetical protein [Acidobacteriota bacterium]